MDDLDFSKILAFDWDLGNYLKNWEKHKVLPEEIEQIFFNHPLVAPDLKHSQKERRYLALGLQAVAVKSNQIYSFGF